MKLKKLTIFLFILTIIHSTNYSYIDINQEDAALAAGVLLVGFSGYIYLKKLSILNNAENAAKLFFANRSIPTHLELHLTKSLFIFTQNQKSTWLISELVFDILREEHRKKEKFDHFETYSKLIDRFYYSLYYHKNIEAATECIIQIFNTGLHRRLENYNNVSSMVSK